MCWYALCCAQCRTYGVMWRRSISWFKLWTSTQSVMDLLMIVTWLRIFNTRQEGSWNIGQHDDRIIRGNTAGLDLWFVDVLGILLMFGMPGYHSLINFNFTHAYLCCLCHLFWCLFMLILHILSLSVKHIEFKCNQMYHINKITIVT